MMHLFNPDSALWIWALINVAFFAIGIFILIKFVIVLFKADKAIDEVREYIRRRN